MRSVLTLFHLSIMAHPFHLGLSFTDFDNNLLSRVYVHFHSIMRRSSHE
jgi:hypothetical protein